MCFGLVLVFVLLCGCGNSGDAVVLRVGSVDVTQKEFEQAFRASGFPDDPAGRRMFVDQYINRKLILLDAEHSGLDKDPEFLNGIQAFWEERLLKSSMLVKFEQYAPVIRATDEEVNKIFEESKGSSALSEDPVKSKDQIRMMIVEEKQNQLMSEWLDALKQKNRIRVDERRLGL